MRLNRLLIVFISLLIINSSLFAKCKEPLNMNLNGLKIETFIQSVAKITNKNILLTDKINGEIDFISNKAICKEDLFNILLYILENKGYTIIENGEISRIIKINDSAKNNLPVVSQNSKQQYYQMITQVFSVDFSNVDYITSKIRHLLSKSAKLVTDKETNSIIITDFQNNINTIKTVINLVAKDTQKHIVNYSLTNANATALATELQNIAKSVFNEKIEKEKVSILSNKDTNSIMMIGKEQNVKFLESELKRIDSQNSLVEKIVEVIRLKNVEAKNVLAIISSIIDKKNTNDKKVPNTTPKPFASIDEESNSIILMGPKDELRYLKELISKLDIDKQQVYVQARIIEISETRVNNLGIQWGLSGFNSAGSGLSTFSSQLNGGGTVSTIDLTSLTTFGYDISTLKSGLSLGATINLLKQNRALDVVSEPSILCINNKESSIYVGETRSIQTGSTTSSAGSTTSTYSREDIGLTLKVKPRISNDEKVTLDISTILEDASETSTTNDQPDTSKKEVITTAIVNNGESVILGGLIKNKVESTEDKVPLLGDIPILGALFRNSYELSDKINLVIIVTPYLIPKSKDLTYVREQLSELKMLEDKYTKDLELRIENKKLSASAQDLLREKRKLELKENALELKEEMIDYVDEETETNEYLKEEMNDINEDSYLQNKRVKEIFGR